MFYFKCASRVNPQVSQLMANTNIVQKMLRIQNECGQLYDFCRVADMLVRDIACLIFIIEL